METKNLLKSLKRRLSWMLCLVAFLAVGQSAFADDWACGYIEIYKGSDNPPKYKLDGNCNFVSDQAINNQNFGTIGSTFILNFYCLENMSWTATDGLVHYRIDNDATWHDLSFSWKDWAYDNQRYFVSLDINNQNLSVGEHTFEFMYRVPSNTNWWIKNGNDGFKFKFSVWKPKVSLETENKKAADKYVGDYITSATGSWDFYFWTNGGWSAADDVQAVIYKTSDCNTSLAYYNATYQDKSGDNQKVKANFGGYQFTSAGEYAVKGRYRDNSSRGSYAYTNSKDNWTDNTNRCAYYGTNYDVYWEVSAVPNATSQSATAASSSQINLSWTRNSTKTTVMVVRYLNSASVTAPTQGQEYNTSTKKTIGAGTVIFKGTTQTFNDTGLSDNTTYKYYFYTVNNNYYSSGVNASATTPSACDDPSSGFTVLGDWSGNFSDNNRSVTLTSASGTGYYYNWWTCSDVNCTNPQWIQYAESVEYSPSFNLPGTYSFQSKAGCNQSALITSAPKTIDIPFPKMRIEGSMVKGGWYNDYPAENSIEATSTDGTYVFEFSVSKLEGPSSKCGFRIGQQYKKGTEWANANAILGDVKSFTGCSSDNGYHFDHSIDGLKVGDVVRVTVVMKAYNNYSVTLERTCESPSISAQPASKNYCQNVTATPLSVTASGTDLQYQWQKSTTSATEGFSDIEDEESATYTPSTATVGTAYYRCIVSNDCGEVTSNAATIRVDAPSVPGQVYIAGTSSISTEICTGGSVTLTADPNKVGSVTKWWYKESGMSDYEEIPNSAQDTYTPENITIKTQYKVSVKNGACTNQGSGAATVNVKAQAITRTDANTFSSAVGDAAQTKTFTFTQCGYTIAPENITVVGANAGEFSLGTKTISGENISVQVTFNPASIGSKTASVQIIDSEHQFPITAEGTCNPTLPASVEASYLVNPNNHVDDTFWHSKFSDGHRTLELRVAKNANYSYYAPVLIDGSGNEVLNPTVAANHATFGERTEDATFYYFPVLLDLPSTTYKFKVRVGCSYENSTESSLLQYTSPAVQMGIAGPLFYQSWDCMAQGEGFNGSMTPDPSNPLKWTQELMIDRAENTEDWINHFAIFQRYKRDNAEICKSQPSTEGWAIYDDDSGDQTQYANKIGYAQNQTLLPAENCPFEIKLDETTYAKTGNYRLKDEANITNFSKVKITVEMTGWDTYSIKMEVTCMQPTAGFDVIGDWTTGPFADNEKSRKFTLSSVLANNYSWYEDGVAMTYFYKDMSKTYTLPGSHTYKVAAGCDGDHLVESANKTINMPFPAMKVDGMIVSGDWPASFDVSGVDMTCNEATYTWTAEFNVNKTEGVHAFRVGQQNKKGSGWTIANADIIGNVESTTGCTKDGTWHFDHTISNPDLVATEKVKVTVVMTAWNRYNVTLERICGKPYIHGWTIPSSACAGSDYPVTAEFWSNYGPISTYDWSATEGWTAAKARTTGNSNTFTAGSSNGTITVTATSHCSAEQSQPETSSAITVYPVPTVSISAPDDACGTGDVTFTSSNVTPAGATVSWYEGDTHLGDGDTYTFSGVTGGTTKTVKAKAAKDGCESAFTAEVSGSRIATPIVSKDIDSPKAYEVITLSTSLGTEVTWSKTDDDAYFVKDMMAVDDDDEVTAETIILKAPAGSYDITTTKSGECDGHINIVIGTDSEECN